MRRLDEGDEFLSKVSIDDLRNSKTYKESSNEKRQELISRRARVLDRIRKRAVRKRSKPQKDVGMGGGMSMGGGGGGSGGGGGMMHRKRSLSTDF